MKQAKAKSTDSEARERILETAKKLFYEQGYISTGINQVIAEAKVAKNTFYYYFPSKEDLCIAYLESRHENWMNWLTGKVEANKNPLDKLLGIFDYLREWMKDCRFRGCAFLNINAEIPNSECRIREVAARHKSDFHQMIEGIIGDLKASDKKYQKLQVKDAARAVYVLVEGAIVSCQNFDDCWPVTSAKKTAKLILLNGG